MGYRLTSGKTTLVALGSLAFLTLVLAPVAAAAGAVDSQDSIALTSRTLVVPVDRAESVRAITEIAAGEHRRVLLQLERIPDAQERASLEASGIRLLQYVSNKTWFASVSGALGPSNTARLRMFVRRLRAGGAGASIRRASRPGRSRRGRRRGRLSP